LALQEALANGYDEALMLDHEGFAAEGSAENLFVIRNGKIYTPETTSALEGITRDTVITIAREQGFEVIENALPVMKFMYRMKRSLRVLQLK